MPELRIHGVVAESAVDGPGLRYVVFTQGCLHGCPGCHNPETHNPAGGRLISALSLFQEMQQNPLLAGVTFSGGEPFLQPEPLVALGRAVREAGKNIVVYTGFTFEELQRMGEKHQAVQELLNLADMLIDGLYVASLRQLDGRLKGSSNQRVWVRGAEGAFSVLETD